MLNEKYSAGLVSQSFWFVEMKAVIKLMRLGKTKDEIKSECLDYNLFGANKENRAKRMYGYIWNRAKQIDDGLLNLFLETDVITQKIINLIAIIKNDRLFFEFLFEVYREKIFLNQLELTAADINIFFKNKEVQCTEILEWSDSTKKRLRGIYITFMLEANLISIDKDKKQITKPIIDSRLEKYLVSNNEEVILKAITGGR